MSGKIYRTAWLLAAVVLSQPAASEPIPAMAGKNGWIFSGFEQIEPGEAANTNLSVELIRRFNEVLARNGVTMVLAMAPIKSRVYAEHLPAELPLSPYMAGYYDSLLQSLRAAQVHTADINSAFMNSPKRMADTPLYFRLDSHWSPSGALLAAQAIRGAIDANPALKQALSTAPETNFNLTLDKTKGYAEVRDLADRLPQGGRAFPQERVQDFKLSGAKPARASLQGDANDPLIALLGSSYSAAWTRFSDALRYTLQHDILSMSVNAVQGSWVGMEEYLMNDAFQTRRPKLIVWEVPERDMRSPPNYRYREARYQIDNREWLMRASAWAQARCTPSSVKVSIAAGGLASGGTNQVQAGATADTSYLDLTFDKPLGNLDYLSASMATGGSRALQLDASGDGEKARRFTVRAAGDGAMHALRVPLPGAARGFTKVRIYPGRNNTFALKDLQVCRQPENLLN